MDARASSSQLQTACDLVWASAQRTPDAAAIVDPTNGVRLGYAQVAGRVNAIASRLAGKGIRPGDLVATVAPNSLEHALTLLALERLGAVPALISPRLEVGTVAELMRRGEIAHAFVAPGDELMAAVGATVQPDGSVVALDEVAAEATGTPGPEAEDRAVTPGGRDPDEAAFIFYTSGTTGIPKGVVIPHRATVPRVVFMATQGGLRFGSHNRVAGVLPLSHVMGFYATFLATLAFNGVYYVVSRWDPSAMLDLIDTEGITALIASPTHLYDLLESPGFSAERARSLETVAHAGAPITPSLLERLVTALPAAVWQVYGTTEMMNSLYAGPQRARPQVLRPGLFAAIRVVRLGGGVEDLTAPEEDGELVAAMDSPAAFSGYLNAPAATAEKITAGWYRTGDAAAVTPDGEIELRGRCDDMIICGAENIHPEEVEAVVADHPGVEAAAVVGVTSPRWGEVPIACIEPGGRAPESEELDRHCRASALPNYERPRHYLFVEQLPRNAMNKVLRQAVRELAATELSQLPSLQFEAGPPGRQPPTKPQLQDR